MAGTRGCDGFGLHRCAPSPACGGGLGWGCLRRKLVEWRDFPHPPRSDERVDLPRKRERCANN